jgi:GNAT superfamily N-acetyltransferase
VQLLTYDELRPEMAPTLALTHMGSFGDPPLPRDNQLYRRAGILAPYGGVFAVEGAQVVGQTYVLRFPFRFPDGPGTMGGIAAVTTRADRGGRGVARRVLEEVHRREREDGVDRVALWTNRSWAAHRLYEKLGYRDIYHPPVAARWLGTRANPPAKRTVRRARPGDLAAMEELHTRVTADRWGFTPRPARWLRVEAKVVGKTYLAPFWVVLERGRLVGYAQIHVAASRAYCGELIAATSAAGETLRRHVERLAKGKWAVFDRTVATDRRALLRRLGYAEVGRAWYVLMGATPRAPKDVRTTTRTFGADDPRWCSMSCDRF